VIAPTAMPTCVAQRQAIQAALAFACALQIVDVIVPVAGLKQGRGALVVSALGWLYATMAGNGRTPGLSGNPDYTLAFLGP
jgi:hypothetical protein